MKTLKSVLTLSVLMAFASAGALAEGDKSRAGQPGYARADDGKPAYEGIGEKTGLESLGANNFTGPLDLADEPGFGEWSSSEAGNAQPGKGAPWSGYRPRK